MHHTKFTAENYVPMPIHKLSVIIPAYNEARTIVAVFDKIAAVNLLNGIVKEVIIVDDHSADDTARVVDEYVLHNPGINIRYYRHSKNRGKGAALHTGIGHATGELLIIQDADLEYDPADYNKLLEPVLAGRADVVYGSRFDGVAWWRFFGSWHLFGNKVLTMLSNMFTGLRLTDMETCYKLIPVPLIRSLRLTERGFGFEPEVTAHLARLKGIRVSEVKVSYRRRTVAEGKKIGWRDGLRAAWVIIRLR